MKKPIYAPAFQARVENSPPNMRHSQKSWLVGSDSFAGL
jgi:hypothetical protein